MDRFEVAFHSFEDVRDFVFLASRQSFDISLTSGGNTADGKSLMVVLGLDYSHPLEVRLYGSPAENAAFAEAASRFRVY